MSPCDCCNRFFSFFKTSKNLHNIWPLTSELILCGLKNRLRCFIKSYKDFFLSVRSDSVIQGYYKVNEAIIKYMVMLWGCWLSWYVLVKSFFFFFFALPSLWDVWLPCRESFRVNPCFIWILLQVHFRINSSELQFLIEVERSVKKK